LLPEFAPSYSTAAARGDELASVGCKDTDAELADAGCENADYLSEKWHAFPKSYLSKLCMRIYIKTKTKLRTTLLKSVKKKDF